MKIRNIKVGLLITPIVAVGAIGVIFNNIQKNNVNAGAATADDISLSYISAQSPYVRVNDMTQYPYGATVRIANQKNGVTITYCSGQIIAPNIVITASHCFLKTDGKGNLQEERDAAVVEYSVVGGPSHMNNPEASRNSMSTTKILYYDRTNYIADAAGGKYDIAFLVFDKPFQTKSFTAKPTPIIDSGTTITIGQTLSYSGFPGQNPEQVYDENKNLIDFPTGVTPGLMYKTNGPVQNKQPRGIYRVDMSVVSGSSGSGVLNSQNRVIGVNIARSLVQVGGYEIMAPLEDAALTFAQRVVSENALKQWHTENGKRYYFQEDGSLATGEKVIDGRRYRFSTTTGEMEADLGEVQRGTVKVKHINEDGQEISPMETIVNNQTYGTRYTAQPKTIANYNAGTLVSGSNTGEVNAPELILTYRYTHKRGTVTVKAVDEDGATLYTDTVSNNQKYGANFTIQPRQLKYKTLNAGQTLTGTISRDSQEVVIRYTHKRGSIKMIGVDENGEEIYSEVVANNIKLGQNFTARAKTVENYDLDAAAWNADGLIEGELTEERANVGQVKFTYTHKRGSVIVKMLDQDGKILEEKTIADNQKYGEVVKVEPAQIAGYTLNEGQDSQEITISKDEQIVEFRYTVKKEAPAPNAQGSQQGGRQGESLQGNSAQGGAVRGSNVVGSPNTGHNQSEQNNTVVIAVIIGGVIALIGVTVVIVKKNKK